MVVENPRPGRRPASRRLSNGESLFARTVFLATGKHDLRGFARSPARQSDLVGFKMHWQFAPAQTSTPARRHGPVSFPGGYGGFSLVENESPIFALSSAATASAHIGGWTRISRIHSSRQRFYANFFMGANALWPRPLAISPIPYGYLADWPARPLVHWRSGRGHSILYRRRHLDRAAQRRTRRANAPRRRESCRLSSRVARPTRQRDVSATVLSRFLVTAPGRGLAPLALALVPSAMRCIAASTRVPSRALVPIAPLANSTPAR